MEIPYKTGERVLRKIQDSKLLCETDSKEAKGEGGEWDIGKFQGRQDGDLK